MIHAPAFTAKFSSAAECVLTLQRPEDQTVVLVRNRSRQQTVQRIVPAKSKANNQIEQWLAAQNLAGPARVHSAWPVLVGGPTARTIALQHSSLLARKIPLAFSKTSLAEVEANAVADGVHAFEKLLAPLTGVLTPEGPPPSSFKAHSFKPRRPKKGGNDAGGMG